MHQKQFIRILLFFYLFSSFVSATHIHHHDAHESHADCKVCLVVKNLHSADIPSSYTFESELPYYQSISAFQNIYYTLEIIKGYNAHATPSFS
ncbi:MAG TPA: hypothetical protein ENK68_02340 [Epsilonproteobacteria bacterium]|nr:hypothetical protein [Campylobacterota bacterium]